MAQTPQSIRKCYLCGREGDDSQTCVSNWNEEYKSFLYRHLPLPLLPTQHEGTSIVVCKKHYLEARRHHDDPSYVPQWKRGHQEKNSMKCMYPNTSHNSNTLNKFDGDITNWHSFRDSYETAVHNNTSLSEINKFTYLKSLVVKSAKDSIEGLALTVANYEEAIAILKKRFGNLL